MQATVIKCPICGFLSEEPVCKRCNTILVWDRAVCPKCGKSYSKTFAVCDVCDEKLSSSGDPDENEHLRSLTVVAGIPKETAKILYEQGYHDLSDLVKLALPQSAVKMGMHKTIARRMMIAEFVNRGVHKEGVECPVCRGPFDPETGSCRKCKYSPLPQRSEEWIKSRLAKVTGEVENICSDPDFLSMSEETKKQMLAEINVAFDTSPDEEMLVQELEQVFGKVDEDDEEAHQCKVQIEIWRSKGFDVSQLEELLKKDIKEYRMKCKEIIKGQIQEASHAEEKKPSGDGEKQATQQVEVLCGLCNERIDPEAEECPNCGAVFSKSQT